MMAKATNAADLMAGFIPEPGKDQLREITELGQQAAELTKGLEELAEVAKAMQADLNKLLMDRIPSTLSALNMQSFKLKDGTVVEAKEIWNGSLPKDPDRRKKALALIVGMGAGDLIKFALNVSIDKGDRKMADKVRGLLLKAGAAFEEKEDVHPQTLAAFARERLKNGEKVPLEDLGLYVGKVAKIRLPANTEVKPANEKRLKAL